MDEVKEKIDEVSTKGGKNLVSQIEELRDNIKSITNRTGNIGDDMTQDQKEKAQEVVVPVILTRIASMAAFVFRRSL